MLGLLLLVASVVGASDHDLKSQLQDPTWHNVISEGGIHIGRGRMKRFMAIDSSQTNAVEQSCTLPDGRKGTCRPLRQCIQDDFRKDFFKFLQYICVMNKELGACCPDNAKRGGLEGLAGVLPAVAPQEEDAAEKVANAQNRGCGLTTRRQTGTSGTRVAKAREWPWMVSIIVDDEDGSYCGGSLITERHVLTAAHCVYNQKPESVTVRLGEYDFDRYNDTRSHDFIVEEIKTHELFYSQNRQFDLAILKLSRSCLFNTYVWPVCLPQPDWDLTNKNVTLIGWGTISFGGPKSPVLQELSLPVWDHEKCISHHVNTIFDENICAGSLKKDACQFDSGGPLMYQSASGRWMLVGVVIWGVGCGDATHPGVYMRVDKFIPWIESNTGI